MKNKTFPHSAVILVGIILVVTLLTYIVPSVSYDIVTDETTGAMYIDEASVQKHPANGISFLKIPSIIVGSVGSVLSTIVLLCCCSGAFTILMESGVFDSLIGWLCVKFSGKESFLIVLLMTGFSILGLVVPPHCFIAFVPTVILLSVRLHYDYLVGLGIVLFGATIAAMSGPLSVITVMCQESVNLPAYSGIGLRLVSYAIFTVITILYLLSYARKVKSGAIEGYFPENQFDSSGIDEKAAEAKVPWKYLAVLILLALTFAVIVYGSTALNWETNDISALFCVFAVAAGFILGMTPSKTAVTFIDGVRRMASTSVIITLASGVTTILKQSGLFATIIYYSSKLLVKLPAVFIPTGILILVSFLNVVLPSGPAKGVMITPLLGPVGQLSGFSMQSSVLAYTFGDSFSNYILPYDSTNASYLETARVPFNVWVRFIWKLFLIWNVAGIAILMYAFFFGYGPF